MICSAGWLQVNTGIWIVDIANAYGLTLIGLALILGLFTRLASWSGVGLLCMYYLAYPPFGGYSYGTLAEGSYLIVNKNLIELFALVVIAMTNSGQFFGLDKLLHGRKRKLQSSRNRSLRKNQTITKLTAAGN